MRAFAQVIRFLVYSNIFIALSATAYTARTSLLLYGNNGNWHVNSIVFAATLLLYCFHRINKKKFLISDENLEERNNWMSMNKRFYYVLIGIALIILGVQLLYMPLRSWLVFIPSGLLGLGYTFPIIPTKKGWKRLRDIYWLKTVWIAFVFSWLTTFLPVVYEESISAMLTPKVLFIFCRALLFIFAICIPFDIRDMNFDRKRGVKTLPVSVGAKASINIGIVLLSGFIILVVVEYYWIGLNMKIASALLLSSLLTICLLPLAKNKRPALIFPLLYDGAMLIQWLFVFALMRL